MDSREQKNALRRILNEEYGNQIDIESCVDGIDSSAIDLYPEDYKKIINGLVKFRNNTDFYQNFRKQECDFVLKDKKIIIEYDERQHFSRAREISLRNYPNDIELGFDKDVWIEKCKSIKAIDNDPPDRDERRALYDSLRDIESYRNGWVTIRFYHGEVDWTLSGSLAILKKRIKDSLQLKSDDSRHKNRIIRLVLKKWIDPKKNTKLRSLFDSAAKKIDENIAYDYLITPGGFLAFDWPDELVGFECTNAECIEQLKKIAKKSINEFWNGVCIQTKEIIKNNVRFITFGIDSEHTVNEKTLHSVQFVALFDARKEKVLNITGKSYPTQGDIRCNLLEIEDYESHFVNVDGHNICLLGCHDLKMFSPRGLSKAGSERIMRINKFHKLLKEKRPSLILHHPHNTDSYRIWHQEWNYLEKLLKYNIEYASAIRYYNGGNELRQEIDTVLENNGKAYIHNIKVG